MEIVAKTRDEPMLRAWARSGGELRRWAAAAATRNVPAKATGIIIDPQNKEIEYMSRIQRMAMDIAPQKCWCLPRGVQWNHDKLGTWRISYSISVENQKSMGIKFRMIIFCTIMGYVYAVWPTKYNSYQA